MIEPTKQQIESALAAHGRLSSMLSTSLLVPHMLRAALNAGAPIDGTDWAEAAFCDDVDPAQRNPLLSAKDFQAQPRVTEPGGMRIPTWDAVNGWRGERYRDKSVLPIDGAGWAEAAFDDHRPLTGNHPCVDPMRCGWHVP